MGLGFQRGVLAFGIHAHDDGAATLQVGLHTTLCLGGHGDSEVSITLVDPSQRAPLVLVSYPNHFRQSVRIKVQGGQLKEHNGTVTAILTDLTGRHEEVCLTPDGPGQYSLDLTSRPQATYLLTLTTASGKTHTVRLMKMSDIFGQ